MRIDFQRRQGQGVEARRAETLHAQPRVDQGVFHPCGPALRARVGRSSARRMAAPRLFANADDETGTGARTAPDIEGEHILGAVDLRRPGSPADLAGAVQGHADSRGAHRVA